MEITRDYFDKQVKLNILKVDLSKGNFVYVREITAAEQARINEHSAVKDADGQIKSFDNGRYNSALVACSLCDKGGASLLSPDEYDLAADHFSIKDYGKLIIKCIEVSGLDEDIEDTAGKS